MSESFHQELVLLVTPRLRSQELLLLATLRLHEFILLPVVLRQPLLEWPKTTLPLQRALSPVLLQQIPQKTLLHLVVLFQLILQHRHIVSQSS